MKDRKNSQNITLAVSIKRVLLLVLNQMLKENKIYQVYYKKVENFGSTVQYKKSDISPMMFPV